MDVINSPDWMPMDLFLRLTGVAMGMMGAEVPDTLDVDGAREFVPLQENGTLPAANMSRTLSVRKLREKPVFHSTGLSAGRRLCLYQFDPNYHVNVENKHQKMFANDAELAQHLIKGYCFQSVLLRNSMDVA